MHVFTHNTLEPIVMRRIDSSFGRRYATPDGQLYPSVTTVLNFGPKPEIDAWRARVGEEEARRVSARSTIRGTAIHLLAEEYLRNRVPQVTWFDRDMWRSFKPLLNRIDNIRAIEGKLYSDRLKLAGTVDLIGDFDGVLSIIDFKTSKRIKTEEDILNYFIQCTAYACMVYERYALKIKQIAVLIAIDDEEPQVFVKKTNDYIDPLFDAINRYTSAQAHI